MTSLTAIAEFAFDETAAAPRYARRPRTLDFFMKPS